MRKYFLFLAIIQLLLILNACKTLPPGKMPVSVLEFDRIEGKGIHQAIIYYRFITENPRNVPMKLKIVNWDAEINGNAIDQPGAILKKSGNKLPDIPHVIAPGETSETELELHLDFEAYLKTLNDNSDTENVSSQDTDSFTPVLTLEVSYQYGTEPAVIDFVIAAAELPRIREPEFSITSIAILQAELINTRFAVTLRIDNLNPFPISLSSFKYELYGEGLFWADGREQNVMIIPAKDKAETKLFLIMNFINMRRSLLDEIIAMRNVSYRFTGTADAETGIYWLPRFTMKFDKTGYSEVLQ